MGAERSRTSVAAMDFSASPWADLLLRILFTPVSDQGADGSPRNSSCRGLFASSCCDTSWPEVLVRADAAVARFEQPSSDADLLDGSNRIASGGVERVAAGRASSLVRLFSFLCQRG